jgi:glycosyltransferase involved in cell wall biosynthesis/GT2 family glycosyltransferase
LLERGHEVAVFAGHFDPTRPALVTWQETDDVGLDVRWVTTTPWTRWSDRRNYCNPKVTELFGAWIGRFEPDVVHFHSLQGLGAGLVEAAADRSVPTVVTLHDFWWWCARQFLVTRNWRPCSLVVEAGVCSCEVDRPWLDHRDGYLRSVLGRVDRVLAVSESMAKVAVANGVDPRRLVVDENGEPDVDGEVGGANGAARRMDDEDGNDQDGVVRFAYVGGPQEMKGIHVLADAVRHLGDLTGWASDWYGCREWLTDHASDLMPPTVEAPPAYAPDDLDAVYGRADVLVVPSVMRESYSLVTREALTRGVPVVTTDCLGPEEVVNHEANGLVVPAADADALAHAMRRFVTDGELLSKLRQGCDSLQLRSLNEQLDSLETQYESIVAGRRSGDRGVASAGAAGVRRPGRRMERVLFVAGMDGAPLRYRCWLAAEALGELGVSGEVRHYRHPDVLDLSETADAVVVYRVPATVQMVELIDRVRARGTPVLFDVDDLIFDPDIRDEIPAVSILPPQEAALWLEGVHRYRTTMERCDAFVGGTPMLCRHAHETTGLPAYLWENGVGLVMARLSDRALSVQRRPGPVRLGYLSGSITHANDWAYVEPAVDRVLDTHPDVELWLVGEVEPSPRLERFGERIRRIGFRRWKYLPSLLRGLDVNLAPLEPAGRFNEAKSAVKWLEAALVATPTVASPTEPFARWIEDGTNGLLAADEDEWVAKLSALIEDPAPRARLGGRARRGALLELAPAVQGRRYLEILQHVASREADHAHPDHRRPSLSGRAREGVVQDEPFTPVGLEEYWARDADLSPRKATVLPTREIPTREGGEGTDVDAAAQIALFQALRWSIDRLLDVVPMPSMARGPELPWGADAMADIVAYRHWLDETEQGGERTREVRELLVVGPIISVVVPVYRPELWFLRRCVESVQTQIYPNWELCLCDDASGDPELSSYLTNLAAGDARIRVVVHEQNGGISRATNTALASARGEWIALLDHDDLLHPEALAEVAAVVRDHPDVGVIYSDDDKIDKSDRRFEPHFKPDWSPDLLLSYPYLGHLLVVRHDMVREVGGLRPQFDGSQDYDLMLRTTERAEQLGASVVHIPRVLYHWRAVAGSAAGDANAKPWAHVASRRALEDAVRRRGIAGGVEDGPFPGFYHVRRRVHGEPSVSIVMPFRDHAAMTNLCLDSMMTAPGYDNFEVVLMDNGSTEPETRALRRRLASRPGVRIMDYSGSFNWSAINNAAAVTCASDLLLFANNDIEAKKEGWLYALIELAQRPDVGAVGARLVHPDGRLQHAGAVLGHGGIANHLLGGLPAEQVGYFLWDQVVRPYSAVTGACMMSRRSAFEEVCGFDEELEVAFNDIDYCMRLRDAGYTVLFTPHAEMVHHESVSRGLTGWTRDARTFLGKWGRARLRDDPYYNPNLSIFDVWCSVRQPSEAGLWERVVDELSGPDESRVPSSESYPR